VCGCSDQAAHYHNLGPQLGASLLTRHIGWKEKKRERKRKRKTKALNIHDSWYLSILVLHVAKNVVVLFILQPNKFHPLCTLKFKHLACPVIHDTGM
jgi:hypothetical protein